MQQLHLKTGDTGRVRPDPRSQTGARGGLLRTASPGQSQALSAEMGTRPGGRCGLPGPPTPPPPCTWPPPTSPPHQGLAYSGARPEARGPPPARLPGRPGLFTSGTEPGTARMERRGEVSMAPAGPESPRTAPCGLKGTGGGQTRPPTRRPGGTPQAGLGEPWEIGQGP